MSHLPFTLAAYLLNSVSVTVDKFLLTKHIPDPLVYIFYFSAFSLLALFLLPFAPLPPFTVFTLASLSTALWTIAAYFMFKALQKGQVSRVIPVIGTLIPLILLIVGFFQNNINLDQAWAIIILVFGIIFLTLPDWKGRITKEEVFCELVASILFAISYLILHQAYQQGEFLSVFVSSRLILIPLGVLLVVIPHLRRKVFAQHGPKLKILSRSGVLFLLGQSAGGSAELLITYSISLATPALVNSLQGVSYIFLFIFSLILSRKYPNIFNEQYTFLKTTSKVIGILLIGLGLFILAITDTKVKVQPLGVTYSPRYAQKMGLDPKKTYLNMLDDLQVKFIRLPLYWDQIEKSPGVYDLFAADFYLNEAQKRQIKVIPVLGMKVPRWPECFIPKFDQGISTNQRQERTLELIKAEIKFLKDYPAVEAWQVENEPFLSYGICPPPDPKFLPQEVALVRSLDSKHPILITDSGELSSWIPALKQGDWFGTTMYRTVWDKYLGYFEYPIPAFFYQFKFQLTKLFAPQNQLGIIAELQTEPWAPDGLEIFELPLETQLKIFPPQKIKDNLDFAQKANFERTYLWGVEWWYYMKENNHPEYLKTAKELFNR